MKEILFREESDFFNAAKERKVVIYDTGNVASVIRSIEKDVHISHIVCDDFWRWNTQICGFDVKSPHSLKNTDCVVLISSPYYAFTIEKKLFELTKGVVDSYCYGFFEKNINQSFKIGFSSRFVPGKAFPKKGEDTCYLNPRLTNRCNLECPFCCVQYGKRKDVQDMLMEQYTALLDNCKGLWIHGRLIDTIEMDGSRELFAYPQYKQAIIETHKRGFKIQLVTNGVLLSPENSKLLLENGLFNIIVSVCGISPAVYGTHQGYNRNAEEQLSQVIENVNALVTLKNQLNSQATIGISYLIDVSSICELKKAIMFWKNIGVDYIWGNAVAEQDDNGNLLKKRKHSNNSIPCNICFNPSIAPSGDLNPCFFGEGNVEDIVIGNVFETPLSEIINTDSFNKFYEDLSSRDKSRMHKICVNCPSSGLIEEGANKWT